MREMNDALADEFGTIYERNIRLLLLLRSFKSPEYGPISDRLKTHDKERRMLYTELPSVLRSQYGFTIESRWNSLMDDLGYQEMSDAGVYLIPWEDSDATDSIPDVSDTWDRFSR
ncbi:hypothetical protein [Halorubellus litoreus]|uniref:Uncharacterized protein n=1 Tax=Halorubellus litoreus TaxID=755308 RepID=A0ABD5VEN6_9EURY